MKTQTSEHGGQVTAKKETEESGSVPDLDGKGKVATKETKPTKAPPRQKRPASNNEIAVKLIKFDDADYPRAQVDQKAVDEYAQEMKSGTEFPAIEVYMDGDVYWLADGRHRVEACRKIGKESIRAELYLGKRRDAVLHSLQANADYGVRRTSADKRKAVSITLEDPEWNSWNDSEIARLCRVSPALVNSVRNETTAGSHPLESDDSGAKLVRRGDSVYPMKPPRPKAAKLRKEDAASLSVVMGPASAERADAHEPGAEPADSLCRVSAELRTSLGEATAASGQIADGLRSPVEETPEVARKLLAVIDVKLTEAKVTLDRLRCLLSPARLADTDSGRQLGLGNDKGGITAQADKPEGQEQRSAESEKDDEGGKTDDGEPAVEGRAAAE
jgi:hypothetical protein